MSDLERRLASVSPERRALLKAMLESQRGKAPAAPVLARRRDLAVAPLSFAQQRLWFLDQLEPGSAAYNIPRVLHLTGSLDVPALSSAFREIVRRHEVLRTTFETRGAEPVQVVQRDPGTAGLLNQIDLSALPELEREREMRRVVTAETEAPFNLSQGPLLRFRLLRLTTDEHVLVGTMHHIVSDGWSMGLFVRELGELYRAFSQRLPSPLPELPIQYSDYAAAQRQWLQGEVLERHLDYWRGQLGGLPPVFDLPTDHPRPTVRHPHGSRETVRFGAHLGRAVEALGREEGATLFMALLSGFAALLSRLSGQEDLSVGTPTAGRTRRETEELIGFFINTLVLRVDLSGDPRFRELLGRVREMALEAQSHQEVPFERLVEELAPRRDPSYSPLFQVMFALQNAAQEALELPGLRLERLDVETTTAKFDLTLTLRHGSEGLMGSLEYDTSLFEAPTIRRLLGHFKALLAGIVDQPERRISELPLLSAEERTQLLVEWSDTRSAYPAGSISELFEEQARRAPEAVAVVCASERLSYGDLDLRATRLARRLCGLGVGPEVGVALCLERSLEMIVGLLAVLKAGGYYVPLDLNAPRQRLAFMIEDAGAAVVLAHAKSAAAIPATRATVVWLDRCEEEEGVGDLPDLPAVGAGPSNLAYLMYTSGSTGQPKGVSVEHRSVIRLVRGNDFARLDSTGVFLQLAPLAFDASTLEIWGPLLNGGSLILMPAGPVSLEHLGEALRQYRVTTLWLTAGLFHQMVDERLEDLSILRELLAGGDVLALPQVRRLLELPDTPVLVNGYGPTEGTTFTCCHRMQSAEDLGEGSVPIGRAIRNSWVHVLDRWMQPVPIGVPGELFAGGDGLARGYHAHPELTSERFVPDPFGQPGSRLYRTGDLGRWLPDGTLEFLGRTDHQVKIRGFRIEPGEIEAALAGHAEVREVAVLVREDEPGDRRLVGYVVAAAAEKAPTAGELKTFLKDVLPDYMVPSGWVFLERLPLTPNGKVDRRSLPAPQRDLAPGEGWTAPRTWVEELLAEIWGEVLKVEGVGAEDDFFALGGHSLLATQVMSRVCRIFGVELALRELFEAPRLSTLAERIEEALQASGGVTVPPLVRVDRQGRLPLSFAQQRLWFLDQLEPGRSVYNVPVALRLEGALHVEVLSAALEEIVRRHESLRTRFEVVDGEPAQVIVAPGPVRLPVVDLEALAEPLREKEARRLAQDEARLPFDLVHGPLLRASLLRLGPEDHALLVTLHHIVSDGWSMGVLRREMGTLYRAFAAGEGSPLAEPPIQYADYAAWQRSWLSGEVLEAELSHWREQLAGSPSLLELPLDRPRPSVQTSRGGREALRLASSLSEALARVARREGSTMFMTLLAAFQALLSRLSGQSEVNVGTPIAGRTWMETEGLIGFFVNTLVLRTNLSGDPSFQDLLIRVRETALQAHSHQGLPFEKLIEELAPQRSLSFTPLFQVMFALQNTPRENLSMPGLRLSMFGGADGGTVKFDLTLGLIENREGLLGGLEYATDLFDRSTIQRLLGHFETLLAGIVDDPGRLLSDLPLLTAAEQDQLRQWNKTGAVYPRDHSISELFERQVKRSPNAVAVVCGDRSVSYGELDQWANHLAHRLRDLGVGPEVAVALCTERSPEMIAGMLGILKAGGYYVPLDPRHPSERLSFMLDDSEARVLLVQPDDIDRFPAKGAYVMPLSCDSLALARSCVRSPAGSAGPDNLVYSIYTSGSTGRPKGVAVSHRSVARLVCHAEYVRLTPEDRVAQVSNAAFDAATFEIWGALLAGACLVIFPQDTVLSPVEMAGRLRAERITTLFLTTALFNQVAREAPWGFASLRHLLFGGEAVDPRWVREVLEQGSPERLLHVYGPTETTTFASWYQVSSVPASVLTVPIGLPLNNTSLLVLDRHSGEQPVGVPGELHIGGDGLARGYLGRADLTAERFVPDPFGEPGSRLYRTGDLVRRLADGTVEFLGRLDHQVKIRGFRIELGEIEAALSVCSGIQEAVVLAREDEPGERRLVAYVVAAVAEKAPTAGELKTFLKEGLPDYMVPSSWVFLERLPLTPNGKVDRRSLPEPQRDLAPGDGWTAPRTWVEELLAETWGEVLKVEGIGSEDDFFALGGHSLLATQVMSRVCRIFGVELALRELFETPRLSTLAERIEEALQASGGVTVPPLVRVDRQGRLPLSFAQQRLWFLDQLEPGRPVYNVPVAVRLEGVLRIEVLAAALKEIVRRHESLRTRFEVVDGEPAQVIDPPGSLRLPVIDLEALAEPLRASEARRLAQEEAQLPFDLVRGPLLRTSLLRLRSEEHALLATLHHIVSDGWSMGVLRREVGTLYRAFADGEPSPLQELLVQYADYATWQRSWLSGEILDAEVEHWRERLTGAPPLLELPWDHPRPAVQSSRGAWQGYRLSAELSKALIGLARQEGSTVFMTLLAAFQSLLSRLSGQSEISVGTPVAGRTQMETESLIGFFVNTLVLRTDLSGNPTFRELLGRVREIALQAHAHQEVPFEKLVEELAPQRSLSSSPLFQVMVVLQNAPREDLAISGLRLSTFGTEGRTAKFDLTLALTESPNGLLGGLEYRTDLFDGSTMRRWLGHFERLLTAVVTDPDRRLLELPLLSAAEREQLLVEWNDTASAVEERCLHELIDDQVERTPESTAVIFDGERLSYRELDRRAENLARHLVRLGVGAEVGVAVCVERSLEMVIGLLAVLKAGGYYVPLDPEYPIERLILMLEDSKARVLLTQRRLQGLLPDRGARVFYLDEPWGEEPSAGEVRLQGRISPQSLAYVIYTSGSTGRPKGVAVPHRGVVNRLLWAQGRYPVTAADRVLQKASFSFDFSVWELFGPLLVGARLVLARPGGHRDSAYLVRTVVEQEITLLHFVPSMLPAFLAEENVEQCVSLRYVFSGGEILPLDVQEQFFSRMPRQVEALRNQYGPTEISIDATESIGRREDKPGHSVPIGRPIENVSVQVLDKVSEPVPMGVAGELCIGGAGVVRGYLGHADQTAERFVPNPFGEPGSRLYRTGDLGRRLADGTLEFLGRSDHQVKVRGFRIELGEIEAALGRHAGVREAVVLAREDEPGDRRLVGYVVAAVAEKPPAAGDLKAFLKEGLPDYMVPSIWVFLESLPLTPSGKVDRRSLPAPQRDLAPGEGWTAPRTWVEELLAEAWGEVLKVEGVGAEDDFFALGGHSLLATQVMSRVRRIFGVELALRELFEAPQLSALAERIENALHVGRSITVPPLVPVERRGRLPLSFAQQRLWFLDQLEPGRSVYNMPVALRLEGALRVEVLAATLEEIVRRHESLRTRFEAIDGEPAQVIVLPGAVRLPVVDLEALSEPLREREARRLVQEDAQLPFDLGRGPLLRASLLRLGPEEHALLATMHHIVSDGWSMDVLRREMGALYRTFTAGEPSPLQELPIQYADYAVWQRGWLSGMVLDAEVAHWRERLTGAPPLLELPWDHPRPAVQSSRGAWQRLRLSAELSKTLVGLARREGSTVFMVLLAAFQSLLSRLSSQSDVSVGTPVAGRTRMETEGLIGFFANTLVLRTDLSGNPPFRELLRRVRETALQAHAHQEVPFEKLVEELSPQRSLSYSPLFQVMLVLQNTPREDLSLSGLRLSRLGWEGGTAQFDLTLALTESPDGLLGVLEYRSDLFDGSTTRRWLGHFERLLTAVVTDPDRRLLELPLLSAAEREQLLVEWNDTASAVEERCLHELIKDQVERTPESTAVVFEGKQLSYRDLDARAERLARHLTILGVEAEVGVAICVERSFEMVVGLLGVLKAGGYYVPLDPEYPVERLALMLEDSEARVLLTQRRLQGLLPESGARVLCLDEPWEEDLPDDKANLQSRVASQNLAYVIYTSGSTGRPKGVAVPHRGVVNRLLWAQRCYPITAADRVLQKASFSFDFSVWELFGPLAAGARLVLARSGGHRDSAYLVRTVIQQEITLLDFVPSMLPFFLAEESVEECTSLRHVFSGGETLPPEVQEQFFSRMPRQVETLRNQYGPTEISIDATESVSRRGDKPGHSVPIGRPITNMSAHVLDEAFEPMPVGVEGELFIGGVGVVRGYSRHADRTAERFVPNPFGDPGTRLYRTGDLGRRLADGNVEFLGRTDHQVKIRGFRIELGEIEAALGRHAGLREVAVLVREDKPGDRRLVAYVASAAAGEVPTTDELKAFLKEALPDYMVPSDWVFLERLPLTPNGKVDRRSLPAPLRDLAPEGWTAPRTWVEELLAEAWSEVLKVEGVGPEDDFFTLGGHSLLATQVISRVRRIFGVELALRELFEASRLSALAQRIEKALQVGSDVTVPPLVPVERIGRLPLSFAQQRLWFLDQLEPGRSVYNMPVALRLEGGLHVEMLAATLSEIVRRHENLRTRFEVTDGEPEQVIDPPRLVILPVIDLEALTAPWREREVRRLAQEEARLPFDLGRGPLLRASLLHLGREEHVLLATLHHVISDDWSMGVLRREMRELYHAFAAETPSPLPELPIQYVDYAAWQRGWLSGAVLAAEVTHWRERLAGAPPLLELPLDRPRPAVKSLRGAWEGMRLSSNLSQALGALARREGSTMFMILLASFQALLSRIAAHPEVSVGTPIAGRTRLETEKLIGFFVNTLVLRTDLSGDPPFRELLLRVRETTLQAHAHQELPFEKLVEELAPQRSLSYTPLFQVMFTLQNAPREDLELPGLRLRSLGSEGSAAKFDLTLRLVESPGELLGGLEYSTDLFDASTVRRWLGHFQTLLDGLIAEPGQCLSDLPLLSAAERAQLLVDLNATATLPVSGRPVHELFAEQARLTPEEPALVGEELSLTYGELEARTNRLAHHLRDLGVGPEVRVAICLPRSLEVVVAMLAVLKSGGAYVPLDLSYPVERLALMLEDAGVLVVVTDAATAGTLPRTGAALVRIDADAEAVASRSPLDPAAPVEPGNLAYVLFTSGSTGRPKGVAIEHRQLLNYLTGILGRLNPSPGASYATVSTFAADLGNTAVFPSLVTGGCLHVIAQERAMDPQALAQYFARHPIDLLKIVPSHLEALLVSLQPDQILPRRWLVIGGELAGPALVERLREAAAGRMVLNHYGPTETTVGAMTYKLDSELADAGPLPIGRPLANVEVFLLDSKRQPVPVGVPGELHIGGAGLARGYLGRPDLTAERFLPAPFAAASGARVYRTGDLARFRPDHEVEFLGRIDHQVKVRGFRIETGEIEAALRLHPDVRDAVVMLREDHPGDRRLVGYVVPRTGEAPTTADLRKLVAQRLPEPMIPAALCLLEALPLTPNGKVDRRALPAPERALNHGEGWVAARTWVEEILAEIWEEVLKVQEIGAEDDFFALGGHSLLATQVVSRVRRVFGIELALRELFGAPQLAALAAKIEWALRTGQGVTMPPLVRMDRRERLPLSFAQQRLWFLDQLEPGSPVYNVPTALRLEGRLRVGVLAAVLGEIARRHESLRTRFEVVDGEPEQVIEAAAPVRLPMVDLADLAEPWRERETKRLAREEARQPFDLGRGPLLRTTLLRLGPEEHVLLATLHHIVSDGWSRGVLRREMGALYRAFISGEPSPLPELPVQYADYAVWQRSWLSGTVLEAEMAYWRERLSGAPPLLELPWDRPRPAVHSLRGAREGILLSSGLSDALAALARREGSTAFMTLLAAFQTLLSRVSGQEDLSVGTPIAGRTRLETEGLIGFFVNTLVLRTCLSGDPSFRELLSRVQETALAGHAHQDLPFEKLVEELAPQRSLSYSPLFQVMFVLQNTPRENLELPELRLSTLGEDGDTAKLDLTLALSERPEGGMLGSLEYSTDLFGATTVRRWLRHFETLLEGVVAEPSLRISELPLLGAAERAQLLVEWSDTASGDCERCLHELIAEQAARTPDRTALVFAGESLSYRELDERAESLACHLEELGCEPEVAVAICLDRSIEMVVALLAVLKAGGCYVPLDPSYPAERLAFMLEDSGARLLLTQEKLVGGFSAQGVRTVLVDERLPIGTERRRRRAAGMSPDHLSYVIYTSGSTGRPKGVAITHRNAVALVTWAREVFTPHELAGVLGATSINFDLSVFELFVPLSCGGRVVLVENALSLAALPDTAQVTLVNTVPSVMTELVEVGLLPKSIRVANLAGEPLRGSLARQLYETSSVERVLNLYGPTEDTTYSTWVEVDREAEGEPSIGRPIAGSRALVLALDLRPVPLGVVGELALGGTGLARGYLGRPDLTAERFVPDPFAEPGSRLYRTGDRARWRADGTLELLGRKDHQVKVRGFRIEPGEIEAALGRHPMVREAAVVVQEDEAGGRRLVAYVAAVPGTAPAATDLRVFLQSTLPDYMLPSGWLFLESLPQTPSGKVDRRALPAPERDLAPAADGEATWEPRDWLELELVRLWEELLEVAPISVRDDFFALGGHSLLAVRLRGRIERRLGWRLPLTSLFRATTVESLACVLRQRGAAAQSGGALVPFREAGSLPPLFCVHPAGGHVACFQALARHLGPELPFFGFQAVEGSHSSLEEMAATYAEELETVRPEGPVFLAGWSMGGVVAFEMARQLRERGRDVALVALFDSWAPVPGSPLPSEVQLLRSFAQDLGIRVETLPEPEDGQGLGRLLEAARAAGLLPSDLDEAELGRLFDLFRRNVLAMVRYVPRRCPGEILVLAAAERQDPARDLEMGWGGLSDRLRIDTVPGNHFTMLREPHVRTLAESLRAAIAAFHEDRS